MLAFFLALLMCLTLIPAAAAEDVDEIPIVETETDEDPIQIIDPETVAAEAVENDLPAGYTFQTAKAIKFGNEYTTSWVGDVEYYYIKFSVTERGILNFHFTRPKWGGSPPTTYHTLYFQLYLENEDNLCWEQHFPGNSRYDKYYDFTVGVKPGNYYFAVKPDDVYETTVLESTFSVTFTPTDTYEIEPNETASQATELKHGRLYEANYDYDEHDCFTFKAEAGKEYKVYFSDWYEIQNLPSVNYLLVLLHDPSGDDHALNWESPRRDDFGTYFVLSDAMAGEYMIEVYNDVCKTFHYHVGVFEPGVNYDPPAITTQPKSVKADKDTTVNFTVKASGEGLSYQWEYRTSNTGTWKTTTLTGAKTKTLSVKATESRYGYQYRCVVTNKNGSVTSKAATLTINGIEKPVITTQPADKTAASGATVKFTVKATGATGYQWYYRKTSSGSWTKCTDGTSATLSVEAKNYRDGFQYRCKVMNGSVYEYSNAATLHVKPGITTQPADKTAASGATVTFTVKAEGATGYQWYYRKTATGSWTKCSDGTAATLSVVAKNYRDGFQYRCKVSNSAGYVYTNAVTLRVKPGITTQPVSMSVTAGTKVTFTVTASGATSYQWYYRKTATGSWIKCSDGTSASLTVDAKTYRNGYQYRCKVMNDVGYKYSNAVTLTVK